MMKEPEKSPMSALKKCPFCGADGWAIASESEHGNADAYYYVECSDGKKCFALGPDRPTIEEAINAWNRRASEEASNG